MDHINFLLRLLHFLISKRQTLVDRHVEMYQGLDMDTQIQLRKFHMQICAKSQGFYNLGERSWQKHASAPLKPSRSPALDQAICSGKQTICPQRLGQFQEQVTALG